MSYQRRNKDAFRYKVVDHFTAMVAWACFYLYRKLVIEKVNIDETVWTDVNLYLGIAIIPVGWSLIYAIFEGNKSIYRRSRLATLSQTFFLSFVGAVFLFFTLILDDTIQGYFSYYHSFLALFSIHFLCTAIGRTIFLTRAGNRLKSGQVNFNTLIIGGNQNALDLYQEIRVQKYL